MTYCHICEHETETYGEMDPGKGVVLKCCVCKAPSRVAPAPVAALAIVPVAPRPPRIVEAPVPPAAAPLTASALLAAAAARRAAVGAALAEMASLQAEALVLDRILAAAEPLN